MECSLFRELDSLLSTDIGVMQVKEVEMFDELAGPFADSIVLYGAGSLGKKIVRGLRSVGIERDT